MALNGRQIEVLRILMMTGDSARIAKTLGISRTIVFGEIAEIYRYVQVRRRRELLPLMVQTGAFVLIRRDKVGVGEEVL